MPTRTAISKVDTTRTGEAGTGIIEFLFALPFLLFVIILALNFCRAYLAQQRAMVAVRYVAWSDVQHDQALPSSADVSRIFFAGEPVEVSSGEVSLDSSDQNALGAAGDFLSDLSKTRNYRLQYRYRPLFVASDYFGKGTANWFPDIEVSSSIVVDSQDWRYPDMTFFQILKGALGRIANLFRK